MTDRRLNPRGIKPGTNGDVLKTAGGLATWGVPPASGVQTVTATGTAATVDNTDPANPVVSVALLVPLTTETGGVPDFVWDDDNQLVMTTEAH